MSGLLPTVARVDLSESVHSALVAAILDGRLPQGTWLREPALASELGVSNTPVREALVRLCNDGLAERMAGRGVRVVVLGPKDIMEIYDLRTALECLAVRLTAERPPRETLEQLRPLLDEMDRAVEENAILDYRKAHRKWHRELVRASGSRRLLDAYARLQLQVELLVSTTVHFPGKPERSSVEHREILDAVRRGDGDHAEALMRVHIQQAKIDLLRHRSKQTGAADKGGQVL